MNRESFHSALAVEMDRWDALRSEGISNLSTQTSDDDLQATRKSLVGEYNSHIRRVDSLWRQFMDDYKREKGLLNI